MKIWLTTLFLFLFIPLAQGSEETPQIGRIEAGSIDSRGAGKIIHIYGNSFGIESSALKILLNGKSYPVKTSYGNHLEFELTSDMRSGQITLVRTQKLEKDSIELNSLPFDLELGESQIDKIDTPEGLKTFGEIHLKGKNLKDTKFWCGNWEFDEIETREDLVRLRIPNRFLDCEIRSEKKGFIFETKQKLKFTPLPQFSSFSKEGKLIQVFGSG
nr:hypothetical protein [Candidatus Gracilibacteria bacterium]